MGYLFIDFGFNIYQMMILQRHIEFTCNSYKIRNIVHQIPSYIHAAVHAVVHSYTGLNEQCTYLHEQFG